MMLQTVWEDDPGMDGCGWHLALGWDEGLCLIMICGFPGGSMVKNSPAKAGDMGSIPRLGKVLELQLQHQSLQ